VAVRRKTYVPTVLMPVTDEVYELGVPIVALGPDIFVQEWLEIKPSGSEAEPAIEVELVG